MMQTLKALLITRSLANTNGLNTVSDTHAGDAADPQPTSALRREYTEQGNACEKGRAIGGVERTPFGQRKSCDAVAAIGCTQQVKQNIVLADLQKLPVQRQPPVGAEVEREGLNLADKRVTRL